MGLTELEQSCSRKAKRSLADKRREVIDKFVKDQHLAKFAKKKSTQTKSAQIKPVIPIKPVHQTPPKMDWPDRVLAEDKLIAKFKEATKKKKT